MTEEASQLIPIDELRIGHFVYIDLGWLAHPFPLNAFKIRTQGQIDTLHGLKLKHIRVSLEKSDPLITPSLEPIPSSPPLSPNETARLARARTLSAQHARLRTCNRDFSNAARVYDGIAESFRDAPESSRKQSELLVDNLLTHLHGNSETSIRLLSEQVGNDAPLHSVNVAVISLLLGKALELDAEALRDLGIGALLHDLGKVSLPAGLRHRREPLSPVELTQYQQHVIQGIADGRHMGLSAGALQVIAQHHERADGSGFPRALTNASLSLGGRIVALSNEYDKHCNPGISQGGMTPHEALSYLFVQQKSEFDSIVLGAFIRMMGIYPPGSVVQLTDDRFALVVSANSSRPLMPHVVVYQAEIPAGEALMVDLESTPELGIRRSLKPQQLPKPALDYLSPRHRICYFFEQAPTISNAVETV